MHSWGLRDRHQDSSADPPGKKPARGDLLVIGPEVTELRRSLGNRKATVRVIASCLFVLAVLAVLSGLLAPFYARDLRVVQLSRRPIEDSVGDERLRIVLGLAPWVVYTIAGPWLLCLIGRGLRRLLPSARWAALIVLILVCLPSLAAFNEAFRDEEYVAAAARMMILLAPAAAIAVLEAPKTQLVFWPNYRAAVANSPGWKPELSPLAQLAGKLLLITLGLGVIVVLMAVSGEG